MVFEQGFQQSGAVEIGPEDVGNVQLGVGDLPQQKIADAQFPAGADQKIGIGQPGGVEMVRDHLLADAKSGQRAVRGGGANAVEQRVEGVDQLGARAVVERHYQLHAGVLGSELDAALEVAAHAIGQLGGASDDQ